MFCYCYNFSKSRTNNAVLKARAEIKKFAIKIGSQKNNAPRNLEPILSHQISHSDSPYFFFENSFLPMGACPGTMVVTPRKNLKICISPYLKNSPNLCWDLVAPKLSRLEFENFCLSFLFVEGMKPVRTFLLLCLCCLLNWVKKCILLLL